MAREGCTQLTHIIIAPSDQVDEGDRLFQSHRAWMEATHHRDGEKALLSYEVSRAPELTDPLDADSEPTGNTIFVLTEVCQSDAGIADHFEQAEASWDDFGAVGAWLEKCKGTLVPPARVIHSLWQPRQETNSERRALRQVSDSVERLNAALEGRYRIEAELGEGGMATVYLADDIIPA